MAPPVLWPECRPPRLVCNRCEGRHLTCGRREGRRLACGRLAGYGSGVVAAARGRRFDAGRVSAAAKLLRGGSSSSALALGIGEGCVRDILRWRAAVAIGVGREGRRRFFFSNRVVRRSDCVLVSN